MLRDDLSTLIKFSIFPSLCALKRPTIVAKKSCLLLCSFVPDFNKSNWFWLLRLLLCVVQLQISQFSPRRTIKLQWSVEWVSNSMPKLIFYQLHTHTTDPDNDSLDPANASPGHPIASWFCCTIRTCLDGKMKGREKHSIVLRKDVNKSQLNLTVRNELEAILEMEDFRDSINQVHRVSFPLLISLVINAIFIRLPIFFFWKR